MLNGLAIQALTSEAALDSGQIRDDIVSTLFGGEVSSGAGSTGAKRKRVPVRG